MLAPVLDDERLDRPAGDRGPRSEARRLAQDGVVAHHHPVAEDDAVVHHDMGAEDDVAAHRRRRAEDETWRLWHGQVA